MTTDNPQQDFTSELPTLPPSGKPQETRITSAEGVRSIVQTWIRNDDLRAMKRARVAGLVQGNPPYRYEALKSAGRSDATNINWRVAEAHLDPATGAFYDVFSEAPTFATVQLRGRNPESAQDWSDIATEEFHWLLSQDKSWDYTMQNSIQDMVLYGCGPLMFEDGMDWRNRYVQCKNLQVPDGASSDVNKWDSAAILIDYLPHQLYEFIRNPKEAGEVGWNVPATRKAIINAHSDVMSQNEQLNWEWHQQQLKENSFSYSGRSKVIQACHFYAREFPKEGQPEGRISHAIIILNPTQDDNGEKFLFESIGRFENWQQCIHPMYYAHGAGGKHYSVTGMGVKMFGAMEFQNRLLCNVADKVFAPKVMFKPTTANQRQKAVLTKMGDYTIMPEGWDLQQVALGSMIEDGIVLNREITNLVGANLSSYRQNLQQKEGNPITASEVQFRASEQARLGKTQLNRFYEQLDWLYEEKYRRACNPNVSRSDYAGRLAAQFQDRCRKRGIPTDQLLRYNTVKATRIVGQGSSYMRQQTNDFLLAISGTFPENGRENLVRDTIAGRAGQAMVERYYPRANVSRLADDQLAGATSQIADMKIGVPAVVTATQNPLIYARTFLAAGAQSLASLQQGANPAEVLGFLNLAGPAIMAHLERLSGDPTRKEAAAALGEQFKQLAQATDQLQRKLQRDMEAQQQQQMRQMQAQRQAAMIANGQDPEIQIDMAKAQQKMAIDRTKAAQNMKIKGDKAAQNLALADAKTATEIRRQNTIAAK